MATVAVGMARMAAEAACHCWACHSSPNVGSPSSAVLLIRATATRRGRLHPAAATLSPTPTHRAAAALLKSAAARDEAESAVRGMNDLLEASLGSATLEQALALASAPLAGEADEAAGIVGRRSAGGDRRVASRHVLRKHARGVGSNGSEHADGTPPLTSPPPAAAAASSEPGPPLPPGQMASTDRSQQLSAPGVGRSVRPSELSASDETAIIAVARAVLALALWRADAAAG